MKTPIGDMLTKYINSKAIRMHMPGHKGKGKSWYGFDITELSFSDNLASPVGAIEQSQKNYANDVGCKYCRYLVGGATQGVFAMVSASRGSILVESNSHKSVINAAKMLGKTVVVIDNKVNDGIAVPPSAEDIANALNQNNAIGTVMLTCPNYMGQSTNLKAIYKLAKSRDVILFVDSAHGAHWGLHKRLPDNVVNCCDACVESTHKTLGAMTQTAVLLTNNAKLYEALVDFVNIIGSTSPSYPLLASIEYAMEYATDNSKMYEQLYKEIERFKSNCIELGYSFATVDDFTRIVIDCSSRGYNGKAVYSALESAGIYCEYADNRYIVAIATLYDDGVAFDAIFSALKKLTVIDGIRWDNGYISSCYDKLNK